MRPPSFEEFKRREESGTPDAEEFQLERCPTPGCNCGQLHVQWEDGKAITFRCDFGCVYSVRRNAFTDDLMYYLLEEFDITRFGSTTDLKGLKINALGEVYTDWY